MIGFVTWPPFLYIKVASDKTNHTCENMLAIFLASADIKVLVFAMLVIGLTLFMPMVFCLVTCATYVDDQIILLMIK